MEAERAWATQYAGRVGRHLDPSIPAADFAKLTDAAADVKAYVDRHVAHTEKPPRVAAGVTLTLKDVHDDIDVIGDLFKKYFNLLTGSSYLFLEPEIQHDWMAVFQQPWMRPRAARAEAAT